MNLEEKIRIIEEKIHNLPQEFDVEENHIILNNPRLINLIIDTILNNPSLCNEEVFSCLNDTIMELMQEKHAQYLYTTYLDNILKNKIISLEELETIDQQADINPQKMAEFKEMVHQAFLNRNLPVERYRQSQETIKALMSYERYDIISQMTNCYFDEEYAEEFWNTYPFDQYPFPPFLSKSQIVANKHVDEFPLKYAILAYIEHLTYTAYGETEEKEKAWAVMPLYLDTLIDKLSKVDSIDLSFLQKDKYYFLDVVADNPAKKKRSAEYADKMNKVAVLLFKNGLYDIMADLLKRDLITKEEAREVIIKVAKNGTAEDFKKLSLIQVIEKFDKDEAIAQLLLENGLVNDATTVAYQYMKGQTDYIIEQLRNKNEKFREYAKTTKYESEEETELVRAKLESGFVEKLVLSGYYTYSENSISEISRILVEYPNIEFSCNGINAENFIQIVPTLKQTSRINSIIHYLKGTSPEEMPKLIAEINQDETISNYIRRNFTEGLELFTKNAKAIMNVPALLEVYFENDVYTNRIIDHVNHHEELSEFYSEESYKKIKSYLSRTYKISEETLDKIESAFGPYIIRYIENENILALSQLTPEELEKFIALFPKQPYTMQELHGIYDSLKQYEFSKKHSKEIQIFPTLLHAIEDKDDELTNELINQIAKELDENFTKQFLNKYELPEQFTVGDKTNLVRLVVEKIKKCTGEKQEKYRNILHEMTDYYISKKREQYRNTYDMEEELKIPYIYEEKSLERAIVKQIIINSDSFRTRIIDEEATSKSPMHDWGWGPQHETVYFTLKGYLINELVKQGITKEVAEESINYFITKDKGKCPHFKEVKTTIPKLIKIAQEVYDKVKNEHRINTFGLGFYNILELTTKAEKTGEVKKIYQIEQESNMFEVLTQLNIDVLKKGVLYDEEVYESLLKTMQKRKLHVLPKCISSILGTEHLNISKDLTNIAGFISYYGAIHENVKKNLEANGKLSDNILLNITNILVYAEVYSGLSSVYSQILGSEDAKLIKANPGPNSASKKIANDGRLKEAVERTKKLYERQEVTIPSFEQDMPLKGNKKMHVVVGNFTHPSTLTHGERTGACMRIGGVGESLFEFALDNPNGFHIRFEDPKTNEYISRVTGFRNGNTVFLNELRESCNKDSYSNADVIEACKKTSEMLIELSKDSPCPIENVVVHRAYATEDMKSPMVNLGVKNIKEGLPKFYTDVGSSAIILATTGKQGKFTTLNFDKTKVPTYQPAREKAKVAKTLQEASNRINRVNSVKRLLAGENYEYIEPYQFSNGLIYAIVSDDWYIYVDELGNIHKDIIDIDPRAKEELAEALIEVEKNLAQIQSENQEAKYGLQ